MATQTPHRSISWPLAGLLSLLSLTSTAAAANSQRYCSTQNTATGAGENYQFQSNGHCSDRCSDSYAFAVVQGLNCWCSNYIPSTQVSVSSCSQTCPGYPYEFCGNPDDNLFGYIALNKAPSGTAGASSTGTSTVVTSVSVGRTVSTSSSTSSPSSVTKGSTTVAPVVTTIVNSVGSVITVTSTPTLPASNEKLHPTKSGISGGVVAGIVVAVVIGILIVAAVFFLLWFRKYRRARQDELPEVSTAPQRMNSQMSKNGLLGATAVPTFAFRRTTPPQTSGDASLGNTSPNERRNSRPFLYDQRLNPQALMIHEDLSRNSINTIDDGRDYGRRLNVTNPDVEDRDGR